MSAGICSHSPIAPGQLVAERFYCCWNKRWMVQWDYMTRRSVIRSGVSRTIEAAKKRAARHGYRETP